MLWPLLINNEHNNLVFNKNYYMNWTQCTTQQHFWLMQPFNVWHLETSVQYFSWYFIVFHRVKNTVDSTQHRWQMPTSHQQSLKQYWECVCRTLKRWNCLTSSECSGSTGIWLNRRQRRWRAQVTMDQLAVYLLPVSMTWVRCLCLTHFYCVFRWQVSFFVSEP